MQPRWGTLCQHVYISHKCAGHMQLALYLFDEALAAICLIPVFAQVEDLTEMNLISTKTRTSEMQIWQIVISYLNKGGLGPEMKLHYFLPAPPWCEESMKILMWQKHCQPDMNIYTLHGAPFFSNGYISLRNPWCEWGRVIHKRLSDLTCSDAW